jgi:hypothetical protein
MESGSVSAGIGVAIILLTVFFLLLASILVPALWKLCTLLLLLSSRTVYHARHGWHQAVPVMIERRWGPRYDE